MKTFTLRMFTPDRVVYDGEITSLTVCATDGSYGVLANHEPTVIGLGSGICTFVDADGVKQNMAVLGGILQIMDNVATILSDFIEKEEDAERVIAERIKFMETETARRKESYLEFKNNSVALMRAMQHLNGNKQD